MREIVLDTETTGLDPQEGHKILEIGCVELFNTIPTGLTYHQYINPERNVPDAAFEIHGISSEFLSKYPPFREIGMDFLKFIDNSPLVIQNAGFDVKFLNYELSAMGQEPLSFSRVVDTMLMARKMFPGAQVNLDALCRRFNIDISGRELHGALKDANLLGAVYLELRGGRQTDLQLAKNQTQENTESSAKKIGQEVLPAREHFPSDEEEKAHQAFIATLVNPIWHA